MKKASKDSAEPSGRACLLALALIFLPVSVLSLSRRIQPAEEWPILLFLGVLLASPFGYLGLEGTNSLLPWSVAVGLTAIIWGAVVVGGIASARRGTGVGAEGLLLLVSPFAVTFATWH